LALFSAQALPSLDLDHGKGQFMSGGVVVAPLRSSCVHPAKIVALVGMNDGAFPARGTRPGPEIDTKNETKTKREAYQREQRGMHAILLAVGAAQEKLIVTFQGYAGASGKEASAALPVEMLRLGCEAMTAGREPGFKVRRHGIMSHEQGHESDNDIPVKQTYDKAGAMVSETIAQKIQPNEIIALSEKTTRHWTIDQWLTFWTDPVQETFKAYDARPIWLENPPLESEPLAGEKSPLAGWILQKWVDAYLKRTGQTPTWENAGMLCGLFANDAASEKKFAELLELADDGEPGETYNWKEVIERTLKIKDITPTDSLKCRFVEAAFTYEDWAFACLPEQVDIDKLTPFVALNLLATAQAENPRIKHLAMSKQATSSAGKQGSKSRFISTEETSEKNSPSLRQKLITLSQSCISNEHLLSSGLFELAFKQVMSGEKKPLNEKLLFGEGFGGGESTNSHVKLLMPPRFNFTKPIEVIRTDFAGYLWYHDLGGGNKAIRIKLGTEKLK
jgi:exonuclease V gamma subunit